MRRTSRHTPISSNNLKHFAAGTVAVTGLLALFTLGDDDSLANQIQDASNKNTLANAEHANAGSRKIENRIRIRTEKRGSFGSDEGEGLSVGGEMGSGGMPAGEGGKPASRRAAQNLPPPQLEMTPGATVTRQRIGPPPVDERQEESAAAEGNVDIPADGADSVDTEPESVDA